MGQVQRGDLIFDVRETGPADGDPVLLLHGFPQRATSWDAVASRLAAPGYRCLAPDQRGYSPGARPAGRSAYTLSEITADALAVIDAYAGPSGRVHLVGHDWGAAVAWRLAARHPDRVRSLTAVSVPPPRAFLKSLISSRQALASWYMLALQLPFLPEWLLSAPRGRPFSRLAVAVLQGSGQARAAAERDAAGLADPAALTAAVNWYRGIPFEPLAAADPPVPVPTLFVWSSGDTAITRRPTELAHQEVAGPFTFVELRGVSHWIPDEVPDQLADLLLEHMAAAQVAPS